MGYHIQHPKWVTPISYNNPQWGTPSRTAQRMTPISSHGGGGGWRFWVSSKSHSVGSTWFLSMIQVFLRTLGCGRSIFGHPGWPECVAPTRHTFEKKGLKSPFFLQLGPLCAWWVHILFGARFCVEPVKISVLPSPFATFVWNTPSLRSTTF